MPLIQPDTSQMVDLSPSKPGTYRARISEVGAQVSKTKVVDGKQRGGNQMIIPDFEFDAPRLDGGNNGEPRRVVRRSFITVTGAGSFNFDQLLRCTGFEEVAEQIKANPGAVPFDTDALKGKEVMVVVKNEMYTPEGGGDSRLTDRIDSFLPV